MSGHVGLEVLVHGDLAGLGIDLHSHLLQTQTAGERFAADGHQHLIALEQHVLALAGGVDDDLASLGRGRVDARIQGKDQSLLDQGALQQLGDLGVSERQDARQELDHGDLGPQPAPDRAQLQADVAGADHDQVLWHLVERQRLGRGDDVSTIERQGRQTDRLAAGGQADGPGLQGQGWILGQGDPYWRAGALAPD